MSVVKTKAYNKHVDNALKELQYLFNKIVASESPLSFDVNAHSFFLNIQQNKRATAGELELLQDERISQFIHSSILSMVSSEYFNADLLEIIVLYRTFILTDIDYINLCSVSVVKEYLEKELVTGQPSKVFQILAHPGFTLTERVTYFIKSIQAWDDKTNIYHVELHEILENALEAPAGQKLIEDVDEFLTNNGFDNETLKSIPLNMKLEILQFENGGSL